MKTLSLKIKLLSATLLGLILMALAISLSTHSRLSETGQDITTSLRQDLGDAAQNLLKSDARAYSAEIEKYINSAYTIAVNMASIMKFSIENPERQLSRAEVNLLAEAQLAAHPNISSFYTQFEDNGYDGLDIMHVESDEDFNALNHGSLEIYWVRNRENQLEQYRIEDPQEKYKDAVGEFGFREAEWYLCARDSLKPCAMEPYLYEIEEGYSELMTSLTVPVVVDGQFRGLSGVDVNLPIFQKMTEDLSQSLFSGQAKVTLLSQIGLIVGSSHYQDKLGRPLSEALNNADQYLGLSEQSPFLETDKDYIVADLIEIEASGNSWRLIIELPKSIALAAANELVTSIETDISGILRQQILVALGITLLAAIVMTTIITSIVKPLHNVRARMTQLASSEGDLTHELKLDNHEELIHLGSSFNRFMQKLRDMINELKQVSNSVRSASESSQQITERSNQQTSQQQNEVSSVVTATNEMSATSSEVARLAQESADSAKHAQEIVDTSQSSLSTAVESVKSLSADMSQANQSISQVAARSEDINRILDVIRAIAEQTNLLALNAAIEAARAGEQGRGFAVVADEVRSLASKTQSSTDEINDMIQSLQGEVKTAVNIIDSGSEKADQSVEQTNQAFSSLADVVNTIHTISDNVDQVAAAAEEQSQVAEEINKNLTIIGDAAQMLAELSDESSASNSTLLNQVDHLDSQLNQLRT